MKNRDFLLRKLRQSGVVSPIASNKEGVIFECLDWNFQITKRSEERAYLQTSAFNLSYRGSGSPPPLALLEDIIAELRALE